MKRICRRIAALARGFFPLWARVRPVRSPRTGASPPISHTKETTTMRTLSLLVVGCLLAPASAADRESRVYEMRIYYAAPGKLDDLHQRFRDHTCKLFEKHGITNVGYWVPVDNPESKLIYILAYPNRKAREASWKAFLADPDWNRARKDSEANGALVVKV